MNFKEGDRVKLKEGTKVGTVVAVQSTGFLIIVEFDGEGLTSPITASQLELIG